MRNRMKTPTTQDKADALIEMAETCWALKQADNRKILWLAMQTPVWKQTIGVYDLNSDILTEVENRLYPEYDGDRVKFHDWGWETPEGNVRYV